MTFAEHAIRGWADGSSAAFVIAQAQGGGGLGVIELHLYAGDHGLADVGYWLCREARGSGAVTIPVQLVAGCAFRQLGIERLNLTTAPESMASQRVAERAGFTREGFLRAWMPTAAGRRDSLMFSLLPSDLARGPDDPQDPPDP